MMYSICFDTLRFCASASTFTFSSILSDSLIDVACGIFLSPFSAFFTYNYLYFVCFVKYLLSHNDYY